MLAKAGGKDLLMLVNHDDISCLDRADLYGHMEMSKVRQDVCREEGRKQWGV